MNLDVILITSIIGKKSKGYKYLSIKRRNMEELLTTAFQSGNATAILSGVIVYLIVFLQRKNTAATRDETISALKKDVDTLSQDNKLKQKDIDYLMQENNGIKEDIKEIKGTLNQIAVSIAEIAAQYKAFKESNIKKR